ncbi:transposase [Streptomyces griseoviridis]|uniref:transposase n=1 Tax=Streptomyces TaxID=1883 RepID=UPI00344B7AA4
MTTQAWRHQLREEGATSAGAQAQYSGSAGRSENCPIVVFAAHVTSREHALVDREVDVYKSWPVHGRARRPSPHPAPPGAWQRLSACPRNQG